MTNPDIPLHQDPAMLKIITWSLFAVFGGAAKFISALIKNQQQISVRRFLLLMAGNVFVSGFGGIMGALIFSLFTTDTTLQAVAAGISGYLGTQGLDLIANVYKKKIKEVEILSSFSSSE